MLKPPFPCLLAFVLMVIVLPRDRIILDSDLFSFRQAFCDASEKLLPHVLRPHATAADRDAQSHLWITHSADAGDATSDDNGDSASHRPSIHQQFVWTATAPHITVAKVWLCVCVCVCVCVHVYRCVCVFYLSFFSWVLFLPDCTSADVRNSHQTLAHTHARTHTRTRARTHAHTRTHMHAHTHTHSLLGICTQHA